MKRTDHILALTSAVMSPAGEHSGNALLNMQEIYVIDDNRKPNAVSLGMSDGTGNISFAEWVSRLRADTIEDVSFSVYQLNDAHLPAHIAASFAGPSDLVLQVKTGKGIESFIMRVFHSAAFDLSTAQFITLLDSQPDPALVWARTTYLILESNGLNQRSVFPETETRAYLLSPEGEGVFAFLADNLISEIQIEATVADKEFLIPDFLKEQFIKYKTSMYFPDDDKEYVYLYSRRDVTAVELLALVDAQPFGHDTWERVNRTIEEYADPEMQAAAINEWRDRLLAMDPAQLQRFVSPVCRSICALCEDSKLKPVIPEELAQAFGPDETDQKRAAARSKSHSGNWQLQRTVAPWEYYEFFRFDNIPLAKKLSAEDCEAEFVATLHATHLFAVSIQSSFQEAFGLAHFILTGPLPTGEWDGSIISALAANAAAAGFSERAVANLRDACWIGTLFHSLGWEPNRVKGLLAINLADVFGGMGSWNDEYVEHDQETYHRLSAELFQRMRRYLAAILSPE